MARKRKPKPPPTQEGAVFGTWQITDTQPLRAVCTCCRYRIVVKWELAQPGVLDRYKCVSCKFLNATASDFLE